MSKTVKWSTNLAGHYKQFLNEDGWNRIGADYSAIRSFGNWNVQGGFVVNFTFDKSIENFWELRPWIGAGLISQISDNFDFQQTFRFEWRNLLFTEGTENKVTTRTRYKIKPIYDLGKDWTAYTSFEWFLLPNDDLGARFVNSREWSLGVSKKLATWKIDVSYTRERFSAFFLPDAINGNTIAVSITF